MLLLSGTPVQNNMRELQGLMSLLDPGRWGDVEAFVEEFGGEAPSLDQIKAIQVGVCGGFIHAFNRSAAVGCWGAALGPCGGLEVWGRCVWGGGGRGGEQLKRPVWGAAAEESSFEGEQLKRLV
jgi:hypothetical protein